MKTISLAQMLAEVNKPNSVFNLKYRKDDGSVGHKKNVVLRNGNNELNERRKMNRNGLLSIYEPASGNEREVTIDLIIEFNGLRVLRPTNEIV